MNTQVFPDVAALMNNIERVTGHLREHYGEFRTLELVPTREARSYVEHPRHGCWRTYGYLENTVSHDLCDQPELAYDAAHAFGNFQAQLSDLDPGLLRETIPDFFSSPHRLRQFDAALAKDVVSRARHCADEIAFVQKRRAQCAVFADLQKEGKVPTRIVHGDTKLNNVLFCTETDRPVCVVDLDTCMPGWSLFDFGDLVRFTAATCVEDETDLDTAGMDPELYRALVDGYLDGSGDTLGEDEVALMPDAARLVTLTVGMRFLTDHLAGDVYFKVARERHNLDRARVQFRIVESMEQQDAVMRAALPGAVQSRSSGG
jgi:aminoglycoside phosphotransferase (APT) family kinase protein